MLNKTQLEQTLAILKIFANTEGLFVDDKGQYISNKNKQVILPYCGIPVTVNDILAIRRELKYQLYNHKQNSRAMLEEEMEVKE